MEAYSFSHSCRLCLSNIVPSFLDSPKHCNFTLSTHLLLEYSAQTSNNTHRWVKSIHDVPVMVCLWVTSPLVVMVCLCTMIITHSVQFPAQQTPKRWVTDRRRYGKTFTLIPNIALYDTMCSIDTSNYCRLICLNFAKNQAHFLR